MVMNFIGGLSAAYQGALQGEKDREARNRDAEDRAYELSQRSVRDQIQRAQSGLMDLQIKGAKRADEEAERGEAIRTSLAAIPQKRKVQSPGGLGGITVDDNGVPLAPVEREVPRTEDEILRDEASIFRANGKLPEARDAIAKANVIAMGRASQLFERVRAGAAGKPAHVILNEAREIYNADPMPLQIDSVAEVPGGGARAVVINRDTGERHELSFKDSAEVVRTMQAYYSPETARALAQKAAEKQLEVETDLLKSPVQAVPDGYIDKRTRKFVRTKLGRDGGEGGGKSGEPSNIDPNTGLPVFDEKSTREIATREVMQMVGRSELSNDPKVISAAVQGIVDESRVQHAKSAVEQMAMADLRKSAADPRRYAQRWGILRAAGYTDEQLAARGFSPPAGDDAIRARIVEAQNGGRPLTTDERERARRLPPSN